MSPSAPNGRPDSRTGPVELLHTAPPFVDRSRELALLAADAATVSQGRPRIGFVRGEEGIGKTRLLREFADRSAALLPRVFTLRCAENRAIPFLPVLEGLVRPLLAEGRLVEPEPPVARLIEGESSSGPDATASSFGAVEQSSTERALVRLVQQVAADEPLILAVEDLQWADDETVNWLRALGYALADTPRQTAMPVGMVATVRTPTEPPLVAALVEELRRETICTVIDLDGLDVLDAGELVRALGLGRASQQLVDTLYEASHGSPLLLQAAARSLVALDALSEVGGRLVATVPSGALSLAQSLPRTVARDLDELEPSTMDVLAPAALVGDPVEATLLARLCSLSPNELATRLAEPISRGMLLTDGTNYRFAQHHVRRAVAERATATRGQSHLAIARELARGSADADAIGAAQHILDAGSLAPGEDVLELCLHAARRAGALEAWATEARFYAAAARAMEAREQPIEVGELAALHRAAAGAYYRNQDVGPRVDHWRRALELVSAPDELHQHHEIRGDATLELARARLAHETPFGQLLDLSALDEWESALPDDEAARRHRVRAAAIRSQAYFHAGHGRDAEEWAQRALDGAGTGEDDIRIQVCMSLGLARMFGADDAGALEWFDREAEHAERLDDDSHRVRAGSRRTLALYGLGRLTEAEAEATRVAALAATRGEWADHALALAAQAGIAALRGRLGRVERLGREALVLAQRAQYGTANEVLLGIVASERIWRGEWDDVEDAIELWNRESGSARRRVHGWFAAAARGRIDEARQGAARAAERLPPVPTAEGLGTAAALIDLAVALDDPTLVQRPYELLMAADQRGKVVAVGWPALMPRLLGSAERLLGRTEEAEVHLQAAMQLAEREQAHGELAVAALELARTIAVGASASRGDEVRMLARRAAALLHEVGMDQRAADADALVAQLETRAPGRRPRYPGGLSPREVEVLRALTRGLTNDQIAQTLVISPATARRHVSNIYLKLEVTNRAGAARFCVEHGLADDEDDAD